MIRRRPGAYPRSSEIRTNLVQFGIARIPKHVVAPRISRILHHSRTAIVTTTARNSVSDSSPHRGQVIGNRILDSSIAPFAPPVNVSGPSVGVAPAGRI